MEPVAANGDCMGTTRLAIFLVGLVVVAVAAWVFFTQSELGNRVPFGIAIALILLLVGVGVMASARSINERTSTQRVIHEGTAPAVIDRRVSSYQPSYAPPTEGSSETRVEERRSS